MRNMEADLSPLEHEALNWIIRLTSGSATQADARAFEVWRDQAPEHAGALREMVALRQALRAMPLPTVTPDKVVPFAAPAFGKASAMSRRAVLAGGSAAVAASAAALLVNPPFGLWLSLAELNAGERTAVGERRTLQIARGVTLEMNGRTAVSLDANAGRARLVTGEAFASVAADARPLLLRVGNESWSVQGAETNVRSSDRQTCISCIKGELRRVDGAVTLRGGQQYIATDGAEPRIAAVDADHSSGWRRGVLLFRRTPLADVIEDINRYRSGTLILANADLGHRTVSGMFHTDKIENAPRQLQQLLSLKVRELPGNVIVFS